MAQILVSRFRLNKNTAALHNNTSRRVNSVALMISRVKENGGGRRTSYRGGRRSPLGILREMFILQHNFLQSAAVHTVLTVSPALTTSKQAPLRKLPPFIVVRNKRQCGARIIHEA